MGTYTYSIKYPVQRAKFDECQEKHFGPDSSASNDGKITEAEVRQAAFQLEQELNGCVSEQLDDDGNKKACVQPDMLAGQPVAGADGRRKKITLNIFETYHEHVWGPFKEGKTMERSEEVIVTWGKRNPTAAEKVLVSWPKGGDPLPPIPKAKQVKKASAPSWEEIKTSLARDITELRDGATSVITSAERYVSDENMDGALHSARLFTSRLETGITSSITELVEQHIPSPIRTWAQGIASSLFGESTIREVDLLDTHHDPFA